MSCVSVGGDLRWFSWLCGRSGRLFVSVRAAMVGGHDYE
jgi:hypothetical protein